MDSEYLPIGEGTKKSTKKGMTKSKLLSMLKELGKGGSRHRKVKKVAKTLGGKRKRVHKAGMKVAGGKKYNPWMQFLKKHPWKGEGSYGAYLKKMKPLYWKSK
jgi:hypothetical protein